jgi:IclR family KDG regulon transcriptional repressor
VPFAAELFRIDHGVAPTISSFGAPPFQSTSQTFLPTLTRNQIIAAAAGTLEILEVLGRGDGPMTLGQLVAASGRPKGTVHRMVSTLVNTGFASYTRETGLYALTLKAWRIGSAAVRDFDLVEQARPFLDELKAQTGETVHLSVMEPSGEIVYVAKVVSPKSIGVQTRLGQLSPAWCTATGRSILAYDGATAAKLLSQKLQRRTPQTITDTRALRRILEQVREDGYAVTVAENHPEMGGVAAPIRDHTGDVTAAVGVAMPVYRMTDDVVGKVIPCVRRAAAGISAAMGYAEAGDRRRLRTA